MRLRCRFSGRGCLCLHTAGLGYVCHRLDFSILRSDRDGLVALSLCSEPTVRAAKPLGVVQGPSRCRFVDKSAYVDSANLVTAANERPFCLEYVPTDWNQSVGRCFLIKPMNTNFDPGLIARFKRALLAILLIGIIILERLLRFASSALSLE